MLSLGVNKLNKNFNKKNGIVQNFQMLHKCNNKQHAKKRISPVSVIIKKDAYQSSCKSSTITLSLFQILTIKN